jgi:hypothetical protein
MPPSIKTLTIGTEKAFRCAWFFTPDVSALIIIIQLLSFCRYFSVMDFVRFQVGIRYIAPSSNAFLVSGAMSSSVNSSITFIDALSRVPNLHVLSSCVCFGSFYRVTSSIITTVLMSCGCVGCRNSSKATRPIAQADVGSLAGPSSYNDFAHTAGSC